MVAQWKGTFHEHRFIQGLAGKVAIITGVTRGIGRATAIAFAREAANIIGIDVAGPVSSTLEVRKAAEQAFATFGRIDILFANAGIQSFKPILEWEDADWHDQIDVNLTGTSNAIRSVALYVARNGGGRIIVTSSTQGRHGTKYGAAYSARNGDHPAD